jgi:hypothetical protein
MHRIITSLGIEVCFSDSMWERIVHKKQTRLTDWMKNGENK